MKSAKGTVFMAGERMEVLIDAGCVQKIDTEIAARLPYIIGKLCSMLQRRDAARLFVRKIKIGDTVALLDKQSGFAFRLTMQAHSVQILGIFEHQSYPKKSAQHAVYLFDNRLMWAMAGGKAAA